MTPIFEYQKTQGGYQAFLKGPPELLALLPAPDPTGVALAEVREGVWIVKENDCQEFPTRGEAAFFYLETELASPALKALIPIRAADDDVRCYWPKRLGQEQAQAVYDVLVRFLGAPETRRKDFYMAFVGVDTPTTWEFESWGDHRSTFEYRGLTDFRGNAMTATQLSSLLMTLAHLEIRALFRDASVQPVEPPPPPPKAAKPLRPVKAPKPPKQRPVISMKSTVLPATPEPPKAATDEDEDFPDMAGLLKVLDP